MLIEHALALTLAYVLDLLIGDPPHWRIPSAGLVTGLPVWKSILIKEECAS